MTKEELERRCALMRAKCARPQHGTASGAVRRRPRVLVTNDRSAQVSGTDVVPVHPLIRATQKLVRGHHSGADGSLSAGRRGGLDLDVSPALLERGLTVLNQLFQEFSTRGWSVVVRDGRTLVGIDKQQVPIKLREALTTVTIPAAERPHGWDPKTRLVPKGILQFRIMSEYGVVRQFEDTKATTLDQKLTHIVAALQEHAAYLQRRADEASVRAVFERYEQLDSLRVQRQRRDLEKREQSLLDDVDRWHTSRRIREYLVAFTQAFEKYAGPIPPTSEAARWLRWAHEYADRLNPLRI